jgi:hypothetical protein
MRNEQTLPKVGHQNSYCPLGLTCEISLRTKLLKFGYVQKVMRQILQPTFRQIGVGSPIFYPIDNTSN